MTEALSSITKEWFHRRFTEPTPVQIETWREMSTGNHVMALAPTGSGKTLAAFLVALDRLYTGKLPTGALRVLYISPLKALGSDIRENLTAPLMELKREFTSVNKAVEDVRIGIRNGDTSPSERQRQLKRPPEILVSTPESLNILLLSDSGRGMLSTVDVCIIDEIHAMAPNKRGTLLACALERLVDLAGEFQRIGLTATVKPPEKAAAFLGGFRINESGGDPIARPVTIVAPPAQKRVDISVEALPSPSSSPPNPDELWADIARRLRMGIKEHNSTLTFIDSRKWAEKLARMVNEGEDEILAWAHHGSLSKDMRRLVEIRLRNGELKGVIATASLELGIDIGPLDEVVMVGAPASPSSALQRAGRAGHRPQEASHARIYPITQGDLLASTIIAKMAVDGEMESLKIPENPLDMLAQTILAICAEGGRSEEEIWSIVRRVWSFRHLPRESFDAVLSMLRGRYAETRIPALRPQLYRDGERLVARPGTRLRLYSSGAIPDTGMYTVRSEGSDGSLGSLDEMFVWESQVGMVFHLGNSRWRILSIGDKDVVVSPTDQPVTTEPYWRAESRSWDQEYAVRVSDFLETAENIIALETAGSKNSGHSLETHLTEQWSLKPERSADLAQYLRKQRIKSGAPLPHRGLLVAEAAADPDAGGDSDSRILFFHTYRGDRVNRPLALALQGAWSKRSPVPAVPTVTNESIAFTMNDAEVDEFVSLLYGISDPVTLIRGVLEATPFFGARFREAAGRALLLSASTPRKRQPLWMTRQRSRMLMEAVLPYPDFPLMAEVWRSCLTDDFAMDALNTLLSDLRSGDVEVRTVRTLLPTPFANSIVRNRIAQRMMANTKDEADSRIVSSLESAEIRRLGRAGVLRPRIPKLLTERLDVRRRRIEEGYAPSSIESLKAWIAEREVFDSKDWATTLAAAAAASATAVSDLEQAASGSVEWMELGPEKSPWVVSTDRAQEWLSAFPVDGKNWNAETAARLFVFWLGGRGPVDLDKALEQFGLPKGGPLAQDLTKSLWNIGGDRVLLDRISEGEGGDEICDAEGLEILLRWHRRQSRNTDKPLPLRRLAAFFAVKQGLDQSRQGEEALARTIAILEGYSAPARLWEQTLLPTRLHPYRPRDLDLLVAREEVLWVGSGEKRVAWLTAEGGWRYPAPEPGEEGAPFPSPGDGPRGFWDIADTLGRNSGEATEAIWERVWSGHLTADGADVLRRGVATGFKTKKVTDSRRPRRGGMRGWVAGRPVNGRWYAPAYAEEPGDSLESDQLLRERIRLLLRRYGILSRPILEREIPAFRWPALNRTLTLMELGDEIIGGRWFESLPMPQFLDPECLPLWRSGAETHEGWHLDAVDPASICGLPGLPELPKRREGTWVVWSSQGEASLIVKPGSKSLEILPSAQKNGGWAEGLARLADDLTQRVVGPMPRLTLRSVNGEEPTETMAKHLEKAGFGSNGAGDWIRRPRPIGQP